MGNVFKRQSGFAVAITIVALTGAVGWDVTSAAA